MTNKKLAGDVLPAFCPCIQTAASRVCVIARAYSFLQA